MSKLERGLNFIRKIDFLFLFFFFGGGGGGAGGFDGGILPQMS